ncbi:MAG: hypothetical protein ACI81L_002282 [Verrucomicrobiales bacterium]|jgi:hypothetical protein
MFGVLYAKPYREQRQLFTYRTLASRFQMWTGDNRLRKIGDKANFVARLHRALP